MTSEEREPGGSKKNVKDEFEEATKDKNSASKEAVEEEEATGGGGVKDNVQDELDEASHSSEKDH